MGSESGRKNVALVDQLFDQPCRFDFFQAVRLLEWMADQSSSQPGSGERSSVGYDLHPADEPVRFRVLPSQSFPPSPIVDLQRTPSGAAAPADAARPPAMTVAFMGLTGPQGVLPDHYTRLLIDRMRDDDQAMRRFFDLFNHRVISLFYRAWAKYRLLIEYERTARKPASSQTDPITHAFCCLIGFGTPHLRGRLELNDQTLLYYSGFLAASRPNVASLERLLREYFEIPASIEQFRGRWLSLSREDRSSIGTSTTGREVHNRLGGSAILGRQVWDVQGKFRVRLGPLDYRRFCSFLPLGRSFTTLCQLVRLYAGPEYDFDVQLVLTAAHVPGCRIGCDGRENSYLGWNTWLCSRPVREDAEQAVFAGDGAPLRRAATPLTLSGG